jgi:hypothetical protein
MKAIATASLVLSLACAHAREAEDPSSAQAAAPEAPPDAEQPSGAPAAEGPRGEAAAPKKGRVAGGAEDPSEIPVASSASGLLKPGAEQTVRDKLGVEAGGSLRRALQKFQKEHDLPATGILDQRTVESLGLDPDDVFERASNP